MNPFSTPTKPNTRFPPILAARKVQFQSQSEPLTTLPTDEPAEPEFSHLATLSKQRLYAEALTGDPDLRRCLGHHGLLKRSIWEAKEGMRRYMEEVLESESEGESEDEKDDEGEESDNEGMNDVFRNFDEEEGELLFQDVPVVREKEVVPAAASVMPRPGPPSRSGVDVSDVMPQQPSQPKQPSKISLPVFRVPEYGSGAFAVKEKIYGVVKGLVKRRNSSPAKTLPSPTIKNTPSALSIPFASKNNSCSAIPVHIHIHEPTDKENILKNQGDTPPCTAPPGPVPSLQTATQTQTQTRSITVKGKQYAQRLGMKVSAAVPVTTQ